MTARDAAHAHRPGPPAVQRGGRRAWTVADRRAIDDVLFEPRSWFALDAANRRVPRVVVPTLDAGLELIGHGPVASIVGRLRQGVVVVDVDLPGVDGHAAAESLTAWACRNGVWSLVRPSGGADGRAHVYLTVGNLHDELRAAVDRMRAMLGLSRPLLDIRRHVRPLSAPHRLGAETLPYADPASTIAALPAALARLPAPDQQDIPKPGQRGTRRSQDRSPGSGNHRGGDAPPSEVQRGAGDAVDDRRESGQTALDPRPRRPRKVPAAWEAYLRDGTRPAIGGSDTVGRSNYEAILTGHLLRAGHDHDSAWQVITASHPRAMRKAKERGRTWWTASVWNRAVTDDHTHPPHPGPTPPGWSGDESVSAAVGDARAALTEYAWSLPPRRRPAVLLVGHHVLDRAVRTRRLRVPVPERDLREDTGLDRTTIRHALRALHGHLGVLHTHTLDRRPTARATTSHEFEITAVNFGERQIPPPSFHHPPPAGTWPALPRVTHQLWRALHEAPDTGVGLEDVMRAALLTDHPRAVPTPSQTRTARRALAALAAAGLARCDAHGHWHPTDTATTVNHKRHAAAAYADLHRPILIERLLYRTNRASDWDLARAAALKSQHARQRAWWNHLNPVEREQRRHELHQRTRPIAPPVWSGSFRGFVPWTDGFALDRPAPRPRARCLRHDGLPRAGLPSGQASAWPKRVERVGAAHQQLCLLKGPTRDNAIMPISRRELIEAFGNACDLGSAGIFVGAGLSAAAGLPGWADLLEQPRVAAAVPLMPHDLPLMAEYILLDPVSYSRARLEQHLLDSTLAAGVAPTDSHHSLARIGVDQVWTTNYDPLIERADKSALVISSDEEVRLVGTARKAIIKMHGSINPDGPMATWDGSPVITRSDYETYEDKHRRLWALLRASYLSKTLLFLGFSFADPNIEILQRLARRYKTAAGDRHATVMKRPADLATDDLRRHTLKVRDLEASGVRVHEVASHDDLPGILTALVRRTRPPRLFISGSETDQSFESACKVMAGALASNTGWEVCSLGGEAGWKTTREIARIRRAEKTYDASRLVFHSRRKDGPPPVRMDERVGTSVFDDLDREPLVKGLLDESRAVLVLGGGTRTAEEIEWASRFGLGVVPFAVSGGAARDYWETHRADPPDLGGHGVERAAWERLGADADVAARAAAALLAQAMYSGGHGDGTLASRLVG